MAVGSGRGGRRAQARVAAGIERVQSPWNVHAAMSRLERGSGAARLVTASAGNHGRGLAAAAEMFRVPLVVFTPADAPRPSSRPSSGTARFFAPRRPTTTRPSAWQKRSPPRAALNSSDLQLSRRHRGAATVALKISKMRRRPTCSSFQSEAAGSSAGWRSWPRRFRRRARSSASSSRCRARFKRAYRAGKLVEIVPGPTLADGLGGNPDPETITFELVQQYVDRLETVSEVDLAAAVAGLVAHEHVIAEGAGAAATAAVLGKKIDLTGRRVAVVVSGSNIDSARLAVVLSSRP